MLRRSPFALAPVRALVVLALAVAGPLPAQDAEPSVPQSFDWWQEAGVPSTTLWGQAIDVASTEQILSWTTMPEYTTRLVDHLPDHPTVVSPTDHFGHPVGKPGVLHRVEEIYGYFEALAATSPRVEFGYLGETEEGRRLALARIGSEANLARLDAVREGLHKLSDPRATSPDEAERLIADLPVVYTFYAGLHSPETGPPEMVMEMAYRLAVSDDPVIRAIRDNVVVFIVPVAEPDGRDKVVDWHARYNAEAYTSEDRIPGPPYWGKYIFHDNNRDGIQLTARLTQELVQLFLEWRYPIGHDLHESVPYLYVSTGTGPYNPTVDPITVSEWQWMSNYEVTQLTSEGMPGVWTHAFYDGWYPGYLLWVTNTRNAVGRFYETFGNGVPHTMRRTVGGQTSVEWYRPNPPRAITLWSLRNNTNYMQSGALNALRLVAENRATFLENYWRKANNGLAKGRTEAPYAYVVPGDQPRRKDAATLVDLLRRQGIEIHRATAAGSFGEVSVARGDYVVRMDQPFRNLVKTLMERQDFPEDAPSPYDDVAWTLPLMYNVTVHEVGDTLVRSLAMEAVTGPARLPGVVHGGRGDTWVVVPNASHHLMAARLALGDLPVRVAEESLALGDAGTVAPGAWLIDVEALDANAMGGWAEEFGMSVHRVSGDRLAEAPTHEMALPRIALLHTWSRTQDEGWARYSLDQQGVDYDYVGEDRIGSLGDLRQHYDVILFPHQGSRNTAKRIFQGVDPSKGPIAYTRTDAYPSHGTPGSSEDITGGMGFEGLMALRRFVEDGGTLITVGSASTVPIEFGFLRDVTLRDQGSAFIPGSIVQGRVSDAANPLVYGYGETVPLYHQFGPYLTVPSAKETAVPLRYARGDALLLSGVARSAEAVGNQPALYAERVGQGWVVITGFDALHRHHNLGNHAFVWNAILNWNHLGAGR
jgi:hypothetical protein